MTPPSIFEGRTSALVWPAMPIRPGFLVSGRWPQPKPIRQGVDAVVRGKLDMLEDVHVTGQRQAITARFEIHEQDDNHWERQWPKLLLPLHPEIGENLNGVNDLLANRPLIYEGNHRWAIAQMLLWDYVLVEPQLWFYGDTEGQGARVRGCSSLLMNMAPPGFRVPVTRSAQPKRSDLRPMKPERSTRPFWGDRSSDWRPM